MVLPRTQSTLSGSVNPSAPHSQKTSPSGWRAASTRTSTPAAAPVLFFFPLRSTQTRTIQHALGSRSLDREEEYDIVRYLSNASFFGLAACLSLVTAAFSAGDDNPRDCGPHVEENLIPQDRKSVSAVQGKWKAQATVADKRLAAVWEIDGERVIMREYLNGQPATVLSGRVTINEAASPKQITLTDLSGGNPAEKKRRSFPDVLGIYSLSGDALKICYGRPDEPRPSRFGAVVAVPPGTVVFNRVKE